LSRPRRRDLYSLFLARDDKYTGCTHPAFDAREPCFMSPFLQRKLRTMSTLLGLILSLAIAGGLAWVVRRYEMSREAKPTPCSRVLEKVFAHRTAETEDSVLLGGLLEHRDDCTGDYEYVDQVRRLFLNTQQIDEARDFLESVKRRGALTTDELEAQFAWVNLEAAHQAWSGGNEERSATLHAEAVSAAERLRGKWPDWSLPYTILEEAGRGAWSKPPSAETINYYQLENNVRRRLLNGAFVRAFTDWQPIAYVFVVTVVGMIALFEGLSGLVAVREMTQLTTSSIATANPGYVELKGTLHLLPKTTGVIGPYSNARGVWYEMRSKSGLKNSRTVTERSAQPFILRDATGEAVIEPQGMSVRTRHSSGPFGSSGGVTSNRRVSEEMLKEDDVAYVLGELSVSVTPEGTTLRKLRVAENGRKLLVSNLDKENLLFVERLWFWIGLSLFLATVLLLAWSFFQRYQVKIMPGLLT